MPFRNSTKVPLIESVSIRWRLLGEIGVSVPLNRDVQVRHVMQDEVNKLFIAFFSDKLDERLRLKWFAQSICSEPILRECKIEIIDGCGFGIPRLDI